MPEEPAPVRAPQQELPPLEEGEEAALPWRVAGEVFDTYIIVEQGDTVLLIDKHAAHERMNFDRMKTEGYTPMSAAPETAARTEPRPVPAAEARPVPPPRPAPAPEPARPAEKPAPPPQAAPVPEALEE